MAGICRPPQCEGKKEGRYRAIDGFGYNGKVTHDNCALFDGVLSDNWSSPHVLHWYDARSFIEIEIVDTCRIWFATQKNPEWSDMINIFKFENGQYVNKNDLYQIQNLKPSTAESWYVLYDRIPPGKYKFVSTYRVDSEWFLEVLSSSLIIKDGNYYDAADINYNQLTKTYQPLMSSDGNKSSMFLNNSLDMDNLTKEKNMNDEIFKPIDKFYPFRIQKMIF